ncbi:MAG: FkbM family methyltransferase [Phycisphaeraceae bacterium]
MRLFKKNKTRRYLTSYAQSGEDILAYNVLCQHMKIAKPTYIDIGAHDPIRLSNTYLFYQLGCRGLLIEPDPDCVKQLQKKRRHDKILAAGISADNAGTAPFYRMNQPTLNTFSLRDAEDACKQGPYEIIERMNVPVLPIAQAIDENMTDRPNFVSIDAEGLDVSILKTYDFDRHAPELICIESAEFCENNIGPLRNEIFEMLDAKGYFLYASTYLNGHFVNRQAWQVRVGAPPKTTLKPTKESESIAISSAA